MSLHSTVVGCGAVAQRLYRKPLQMLEKLGLLRVQALVDPVTGHSSALARYFPGARVHADLEAALQQSKPDLTLILTPAHLHCEQTLLALASNSHVLCEKPMATGTADCERMNAAANRSGRVLAVGMVRRFFPAFARLKELIESDALGTLESFQYGEGHKFDWDVTTPAAFRPRSEGGTGVLFDIGPHAVDHLSWTFGEFSVSAYRDNALGGIESDAVVDVTSSRCRGSIHLSWDSPQGNELRVFGSKAEAVLRLDQFDQLAVRTNREFEMQRTLVAFPADAERTPRRLIGPRSYTEAIFAQLVQVVRAIQLGEAPRADGKAGHRCIALLESALGMADILPAPWLSSAEQDAIRRLHWRRSA
jgi:predicted dehydrogenase